ncbi:MAG: HDIG domain-containing protein [Bacteroidota bacterium]|nr:HDIG domain-containing protein [Candidatus Kapabacteria bacterium]MDW8220028.1 HDIG domain-containing protein [Bacteroidota bacterium]
MARSEQTLFEKVETELEKEIEEDRSASGEGWRYMRSVRIAIISATVCCLALLFPLARSVYQQVNVGTEWQRESVIAETNFPIYKPKAQYESEVRRAIEQTLPVFVVAGASESVLDAIRSMEQLVAQSNFLDPSEIQRVTGCSAETLAQLFAVPETRRAQKLKHVVQRCSSFQASVYRQGFIDIPCASISTPEIVIRRSAVAEEVLPTKYLYDSAMYKAAFDQMMQQGFDEVERALAVDMFSVLARPNLSFSLAYTQEAQKLAAESVPKTLGIVRRGETIIAKGEIISPLTLNKLRSSEYTRSMHYSEYQALTAFTANLLHATLIYSTFLVYLYIMRRRLFYDNAQLVGLSVPFLISGLLAWGINVLPTHLPLQYFVMIPATAMLIAIVYDSRTTAMMTMALAFLVAAIRGYDYEIGLSMVLAGTFAGYTVRDLRSRTQLFQSIGFIMIGYTLSAAVFALQYGRALEDFGLQLAFAAISAVLSPLVTFGVLYLLERMFNITSDLLLLEYDNLNHPLLVELNEKAPGTYQHTLMVARLAESAALAISANSILVKVGALFHDIGKVRKAEYFVENQINIANKHDKISPYKSAAIIRQHIQEGIALAQHYKLPQRIIDFIPMHHGTMLIRYFYVKALDEAAAKSSLEEDTNVEEHDFRYPGPRPNSKETGIVMLADAAEAISHVVDTNDRSELEKAIDAIVQERLADKQLEECDLTMKEIALICESFVKNLLGTGHQRLKYKALPREESKEMQQYDILSDEKE